VLGFKRLIVTSVALIVLVAGLSVALALTQVRAVGQARALVAHTHEVIEAEQDLLASVLNSETGERGYLVTQDPQYLQPYEEAVSELPNQTARLIALVADNPSQSARVRDLAQAIDRREAVIDRVMTLSRGGNFAAARAIVSGGAGLSVMQDIRARMTVIRGVEDDLLKQRTAEADRRELWAIIVGSALGWLGVVGLAAAAVFLARSNRQLTKAMREARAAQQAQEATDALARALFAHVADLLFVIGVEDGGRFAFAEVNEPFARALGLPVDQIVGREVAELLPPQNRSKVISLYRRVCASDKPVTTRDVVRAVPGDPRTWESIFVPVPNSEGVVDRIIGSSRDITDRVHTEGRLRDSQRMEAIGQLTGGVAHDFNNLLQVIRGNLELLEGSVDKEQKAGQRLGNALHAVDRAAQLTSQLLAFARRQPLAPQVVNLSRLVGDMADLLRRTLGEAIEVETVVAEGLWNTVADPAQVESAILNLALNARDAMADGGRLTIEIANASLDEVYVRGLPDVTPGEYVMLAVSDNGHGMSETVKARVFEPFFTTKSEGKGTGLGLSMVYGFVKQSNGHVQIYSEPEQGTTVKIYLPRSKEPEKPPAPAPTASKAMGESRAILVVEDDAEVRAATTATLAELGYAPLEAGEAESALAMLEGGLTVDLVFSDVVMPGPLKTRDFAERVRALRPDLPILFTSGYTENAVVHHGRLEEGVNLISKPYAKSELARRIAQLLDASPVAQD
jgi:PAS domain S-box-containing protein